MVDSKENENFDLEIKGLRFLKFLLNIMKDFTDI